MVLLVILKKVFIKDRFMGENTRLLYDLMHYLVENDMDGLLLLIDFEKVFDSIEWKFLQKAFQSGRRLLSRRSAISLFIYYWC